MRKWCLHDRELQVGDKLVVRPVYPKQPIDGGYHRLIETYINGLTLNQAIRCADGTIINVIDIVRSKCFVVLTLSKLSEEAFCYDVDPIIETRTGEIRSLRKEMLMVFGPDCGGWTRAGRANYSKIEWGFINRNIIYDSITKCYFDSSVAHITLIPKDQTVDIII